MSKTYILVGAKPNRDTGQNPGGQMTASMGLVKYLETEVGCELEIIDTTQSSFPVPPLQERLRKGGKRLLQLGSLLIKKDVVGVVIFSSSGMSFYERICLSILCRLFLTRCLLFVRSGHFMEEVSELGLLRRLLIRWLLKIPHVIGAQGTNWLDFYTKLGVSPERVAVVRNWLPPGVAYETRLRNGNLSKLRFVFVGWLVDKKGVRELLEAACLLARKYRFELALVGGGDLENWARNYVSENELENCVSIRGWLSRDDVNEQLTTSDVFVLPSKAEGFPNAMLEAMAFGLPSIVTDVGAVSDSLIDGKNGFLIQESQVDQIYQAMEKYILEPALVEKHSRQTVEIVKELHSYDRNCQKLFSNLG